MLQLKLKNTFPLLAKFFSTLKTLKRFTKVQYHYECQAATYCDQDVGKVFT